MIRRGVRSIRTAAASVPVATATTSWPADSSSRCSSALLLGLGSASRFTLIYVVTPIDARKARSSVQSPLLRGTLGGATLSQHALIGGDLCARERFQPSLRPADQLEQLAIFAQALLLVRQRRVQDVRRALQRFFHQLADIYGRPTLSDAMCCPMATARGLEARSQRDTQR